MRQGRYIIRYDARTQNIWPEAATSCCITSSSPSPIPWERSLSLGRHFSLICISYDVSPPHPGPRCLQTLCQAQPRPLLRVIHPSLLLSLSVMSYIHCVWHIYFWAAWRYHKPLQFTFSHHSQTFSYWPDRLLLCHVKTSLLVMWSVYAQNVATTTRFHRFDLSFKFSSESPCFATIEEHWYYQTLKNRTFDVRDILSFSWSLGTCMFTHTHTCLPSTQLDFDL